ncbi:hypothetical protein [Nonomuraea rubra]|uniref:hypothetical protein n=1 Tax=Nonomuraea rubra TaxID=46180 RepID=UPI0031E66D97
MISATLSLLLALSPVAAAEIPKNFLLSERRRAQGPGPRAGGRAGYTISGKRTAPLELNPCLRERATDRDRLAARTITHWTSAPSHSSEQLVLYKSPRAAHAALNGLRADVKRCARKSDPSAPAAQDPVADEQGQGGGRGRGHGLRDPPGRQREPDDHRPRRPQGRRADDLHDQRGLLRPGPADQECQEDGRQVCTLPGVC